MKRLAIIVPISLGLIFVLLFWTFMSVKNALLIVMNVPFALIGGLLILLATGINLSVSAAVGFIALFGIAVQNGVILVSQLNKLRREGQSLHDAIVNGSVSRLRPVVMTALMAMLGLFPAALSTSVGSETAKPFAVVIIGGLISATLLTLTLLPALYRYFAGKLKIPGYRPSSFNSASRYFSAHLRLTSSGNFGPGAVLFQSRVSR
ncbi:efflux RND transporter permease subunit [Methylomonas koyamae]|uniref:efflux RND transporter permease subunit n=1 Tax=Methylomonas koyamae TaxID=702114 RepID=UPI001E2DFDD7|nr:efflux RND transporter permease subunit [Methylomonas koyamae]